MVYGRFEGAEDNARWADGRRDEEMNQDRIEKGKTNTTDV